MPSTDAIGYIPTTKLGSITNKAARRHMLTNLYHLCMGKLLDPIHFCGDPGLTMLSSDRTWCHCHPIFAAFVGDYHRTDSGHMYPQWPLSKVHCPRRPTWWSLSFSCPQLYGGTWNLWFGWARHPLVSRGLSCEGTQACFPTFLVCAPPHQCLCVHNLRYHSPNSSGCHQARHSMALRFYHLWGGASWRMLPCLTTKPSHDAVSQRYHNTLVHFRKRAQGHMPILPQTHHWPPSSRWASCITHVESHACTPWLCSPTQYPSHTTQMLSRLEECLALFHDNKLVFIDLSVHNHLNIPKLHSLQHYSWSITLFGSADNTEQSECLNIDFTKKAYHATKRQISTNDSLAEAAWEDPKAQYTHQTTAAMPSNTPTNVNPNVAQ